MEIVSEIASVAESRANGEVERYMQTVQGQVRTMKMALGTISTMKTTDGLDTFPWVVMYPAILLNMCNVGEDGGRAYERR